MTKSQSNLENAKGFFREPLAAGCCCSEWQGVGSGWIGVGTVKWLPLSHPVRAASERKRPSFALGTGERNVVADDDQTLCWSCFQRGKRAVSHLFSSSPFFATHESDTRCVACPAVAGFRNCRLRGKAHGCLLGGRFSPPRRLTRKHR